MLWHAGGAKLIQVFDGTAWIEPCLYAKINSRLALSKAVYVQYVNNWHSGIRRDQMLTWNSFRNRKERIVLIDKQSICFNRDFRGSTSCRKFLRCLLRIESSDFACGGTVRVKLPYKSRWWDSKPNAVHKTAATVWIGMFQFGNRPCRASSGSRSAKIEARYYLIVWASQWT